MIIQELDQEFAALRLSAERISEKLELEQTKVHLDDEVRYYQRRLKELAASEDGETDQELTRVKLALDETRRAVRELDQRFDEIEEQIDAAHHQYWGSLLKEGGELSSFGAQVERYADLYMRRVSCLRHYSPEQFFRSPHDFMPHEL
jgi:predicted nuclease with TOPRIM domain